jgi:hypothetical protein
LCLVPIKGLGNALLAQVQAAITRIEAHRYACEFDRFCIVARMLPLPRAEQTTARDDNHDEWCDCICDVITKSKTLLVGRPTTGTPLTKNVGVDIT